MKIGIVGLPNVGKSTLFKALTKKEVPASNYPFCTIDPNIGIVEVPDDRLKQLTQLYQSPKIVPAVIEFVDIAGLVENASKGEGLGNQFLSHIKEVDAITHVIRNFHDDNIIHVTNKIDPSSDLSIISTELAMSDITTLEKVLTKVNSKLKTNDKQAAKQKIVLENIISNLDKNIKPNISNLKEDEQKFIKSLQLLSLKPELFIENIDEESLKNFKPTIPNSIPICAKLESELAELSNEEAQSYLNELNINNSGLNQLITASYKLLNLITFFTAGPKEAHAWTCTKGTKAPQAAGKIHTDFEQGFIRAEIINWQDIINSGSDIKAKEKGLMHLEGKDYIFQDGDVAYFRFSN